MCNFCTGLQPLRNTQRAGAVGLQAYRHGTHATQRHEGIVCSDSLAKAVGGLLQGRPRTLVRNGGTHHQV